MDFLQFFGGCIRQNVLTQTCRSYLNDLRDGYVAYSPFHTENYAFLIVNPPSTGKVTPVTNEAAGSTKLSVMCATSSGIA